MSQEAWIQTISNVRKELGSFKKRTVKSSKALDNPPNAPAGHYVMMQYDSGFDGKPAVETVVPYQEKDGIWKVSGYFVNPGH